MKKIINFPRQVTKRHQEQPRQERIKIRREIVQAEVAERTEDFYSAAEIMLEFIKGLPLTNEDHDQLIILIADQVMLAEMGAFQQGLSLGLDVKGDLD